MAIVASSVSLPCFCLFVVSSGQLLVRWDAIVVSYYCVLLCVCLLCISMDSKEDKMAIVFSVVVLCCSFVCLSVCRDKSMS